MFNNSAFMLSRQMNIAERPTDRQTDENPNRLTDTQTDHSH